MIVGEYAPWLRQINHTLAEIERRLAALERRVERLDTHSAEMARELLDVIDRVDALYERQGDQAAGEEAAAGD